METTVLHSVAAPVSAETTGRLARFPLTEVLVSLLARRASGTLVLTEPSGRRSALYLSYGLVTKTRTHALVLNDDNPGEVVAQNIEWAADRIGSTTFAFYAGLDVMPEVAAVPSMPLAQIWRSARHSAHIARVDKYLAQLGEQPLHLHHRARLDLFGLDWDELTALEPLRRDAVPIGELLAQAVNDPVVLRRLIYVLVLCRHVGTRQSHEPVGIDGPEALIAPQFVPSRPPSTRAANDTQHQHRNRSGIVHRGPQTSTAPPQPSIHPQRQGASFCRDLAHRGLDPAAALRRAEQLDKRYEFDKALPLAEFASVRQKSDAAANALVAYLRVRCGRFSERGAERELDWCHRAVREHRDVSRFRYHRAWVLKAMGREEDAMRDFAAVVRDDPHHIDAARELHLFRQRQRKSSSGFLSAIRRSLTPVANRSRSSK